MSERFLGPRVFCAPDAYVGSRELPKSAERNYQEILDSLPFGVASTTPEGNLLTSSNSVSQGLLGGDIVSAIINADPQRFEALQSGGIDHYGVLKKYLLDTEKYVHFSVVRRQDEEGEPHIIAIARDVTQQVIAAGDIRHGFKNRINTVKFGIQYIPHVLKDRVGKVDESLASLCLQMENIVGGINTSLLPGIGFHEQIDTRPLPQSSSRKDIHKFVFEQLPLGAAILDETGHILTFNPHLRLFSGLDPKHFSYFSLPYMISGSDPAWFADLQRGAVGSYYLTHIYNANDMGRARHVRFSFTKDAKNPGKFVAVCEDVTEEVEAIDHLRGEFIQAIDRLPIETLTGKFMKAGKALPQPPQAVLKRLTSTLNELSGEVSAGLAYPLNTESLKRERVKMDALLQTIIRDSTGLLALKKIQTKVDIEQVPEIIANYRELYDAVLNLIINAAEGSEGQQAPILGIICKPKEGDPRTIMFEISNTGQGIPPEHRDKIFMHSVSSKKKASGKAIGGEGRGTAQVGRAMRNLGGKIYELHPTAATIERYGSFYGTGVHPGTIIYGELHSVPS